MRPALLADRLTSISFRHPHHEIVPRDKANAALHVLVEHGPFENLPVSDIVQILRKSGFSKVAEEKLLYAIAQADVLYKSPRKIREISLQISGRTMFFMSWGQLESGLYKLVRLSVAGGR